MQNNKHIHQYNGYSVSPSAHRLPDGWFAANLLLTRGDARSAELASYKFDALAVWPRHDTSGGTPCLLHPRQSHPLNRYTRYTTSQ